MSAGKPNHDHTNLVDMPECAPANSDHQKPRFWTFKNSVAVGISIVAVGLGIIISQTLHTVRTAIPPLRSTAQSVSMPPVQTLNTLPQRQVTAMENLEWAFQRSLDESLPVAESVSALFEQARGNTDAFAAEALGWDSKWALVASSLTGSEDHARFVSQKFSEIVLSPEVLMAQIEQALDECALVTDDIENELLVRLRQDMAGFEDCPLFNSLNDEELRRQFKETLAQVEAGISTDLQMSTARELGSMIVGDALVQIATRMGIGAGALGLGASTAWSNVGISLAVGVVVDQVITVAYDAIVDPQGQLAEDLRARLTEMEFMVMVGTEERPGLVRSMEDYLIWRAAIREATIVQMLNIPDEEWFRYLESISPEASSTPE